MNITTEQIKELRDKTGISVMLCRKALEDAKGDMDKAIILLQKKGAEAAEKKADRTLKASRIVSYVHGAGTVGVLVELSSESDFVSGNEEFGKMAYDIAMQIAATNPKYITKEDVPLEERNKVLEAFEGEVKNKPEAVREKILAGKLDSYFKEQVLLDQDFIKDPSLIIATLINNAIQKFGEKIEVTRFVRFASAVPAHMCE
jgi:elongation factor Ts